MVEGAKSCEIISWRTEPVKPKIFIEAEYLGITDYGRECEFRIGTQTFRLGAMKLFTEGFKPAGG